MLMLSSVGGPNACFVEEQRPIKRRKRLGQAEPLSERLFRLAVLSRERADQLAPGEERDVFLRKAQQAEIVARFTEYLLSPKLQSPQQTK